MFKTKVLKNETTALRSFNVIFQQNKCGLAFGEDKRVLRVSDFHIGGNPQSNVSKNYDWLEQTHDYIQRLFPNVVLSKAIGDRDFVLDDAQIDFMSQNDACLKSIRLSLVTMMGFFGATLTLEPIIQIVRSANHLVRLRNIIVNEHNLRRITRILTCLSLLKMDELHAAVLQWFQNDADFATAIATLLADIKTRKKTVLGRAKQFWEKTSK